MKFLSRIFRFFPHFCGIVFLHYGYIVLFRLWGLLAMGGSGQATDILNGIVADMLVISALLLLVYLPYGLIALRSIRMANFITATASILFYVLSVPVQAYYINGTQLLDPYHYQCKVCQAYFAAFDSLSLAVWLIPAVIMLAAGSVFLGWLLRKRVVFSSVLAKLILAVQLISVPLVIEVSINTAFLNKNGYRISKPYFFAQSGLLCIKDQITGKADRVTGPALFHSLRPDGNYVLPEKYPLLRKFKPDACLNPYFQPEAFADNPHIVLIIVEGLGDDLVHPVKGVTFMPFLQSLTQKGLYWDHFLAASERDQNTLPSLLGGLPPGDNGFAQRPVVPYHFSLLNILKHNNYHTSYFTGQRIRLGFTDKLLNYNNTDIIVDASHFPDSYPRVTTDKDKQFRGYNDWALLDFYYNSRVQKLSQPRFDIIQTGSMAKPYLIDNKAYYDDLFDQKVAGIDNAEDLSFLENQKEGLTAALYTDEMLQQLFDKYEGTADYNNTVFVITGNYPMPGLLADNPLKKYHVPFIIYSPELRSTERIHSLGSHNDFSNALLGFLASRPTFEIPQFTTSTGYELCTDNPDEKTLIPLLNQDGDIEEMVFENFFIDAEQNIHEIGENLILQHAAKKKKNIRPGALLEAFMQVNAKGAKHLMPDSLYFGFLNYNVLADTITSGRGVRDEYRVILEDLPVGPGNHILDIRLHKPQVLLEDVFIVVELYDESGQLLEWKNYGIPVGDEDFSVRHEIDNRYTKNANNHLRVYFWNQAPVAYHYEKARMTVYTLENYPSHSHSTE